MLRAAAAPERFLDRGFMRFLARTKGALQRASGSVVEELGVLPPVDLARFLLATKGGRVGDFITRTAPSSFRALLKGAAHNPLARAQLVALLASAIPFGETKQDKHVLVYFVADPPARGIIAAIDPSLPKKRRTGSGVAELICRGAAALAIMCTMQILDDDNDDDHAEGDALVGSGGGAVGEGVSSDFGVADEEAIRALLDRALTVSLLLHGSDAQVRTSARSLSFSPLDVPPADPPGSKRGRQKAGSIDRTLPVALGPLVEAFFRETNQEALRAQLLDHRESSDALVASAVETLIAALDDDRNKSSVASRKKKAAASDLARRRSIALRAAASSPVSSPDLAMVKTPELTRAIMTRVDELPPNAEAFAAIQEREETLLALAELGDAKAAAPELIARALAGDANAVDMLRVLSDTQLVDHLDALLANGAGQRKSKVFEVAIVRLLATVNDPRAPAAVRELLRNNPMSNWREGLERGVLVRELTLALGDLEDHAAIPALVEILESTSQEYRPVLPSAAYALGRLRHAPALPLLERLLFSPKDPVSCEAVWAVGAIGGEAAGALLDRLRGLEPGAEVTRLAALAKVGRTKLDFSEIRTALDRALWEPAFRQEETSRRRAWGLRALEELAACCRANGRFEEAASALFLGHEAVRHFATRDDHRIRRAAESAFAAWSIPIPKVRKYWTFTIADLEKRAGVPALLEAIRDPHGVYRHNVASHLSALNDARAVRPLAEATARLFMEPPTSTYEYDDAPPHLVAFVRALAKLNKPEGNDVLISGLRSDNHQVRAVVAENAPDDERFVPELMAMLGDPRSFLRSRAEKSLTSLGAIPATTIDPNTTEVVFVRRVEG